MLSTCEDDQEDVKLRAMAVGGQRKEVAGVCCASVLLEILYQLSFSGEKGQSKFLM